MEQAMETYGNTKRTADDAGLKPYGSKTSPKVAKRFYLPAQFDTTSYEIQCHTNWTGKKLPIYVAKGYKKPSTGKLYTKAICTPMLATKFVDLGPKGSIDKFKAKAPDAKYNMSTVVKLPEKITSKVGNAQEKATEFYQYLHNVVEEMLKVGFETEDVWTKWTKQSEKKLAKEKKKNPDTEKTAWDFFKAEATTSLFKTEDDENGEEYELFKCSTPYQLNFGGEIKNNRPTFWKQVRNEYGDKTVKDITDELPNKKNGLHHGSVVKFAFELNCYDMDTMYGVKAKIKPNILCVYLPKTSQRSVNEMVGETYFSSDEED
jgi:hypothetical protein